MEINKHELYETPEIEVIEVELEYSIAASGLSSGANLWDQIWG